MKKKILTLVMAFAVTMSCTSFAFASTREKCVFNLSDFYTFVNDIINSVIQQRPGQNGSGQEDSEQSRPEESPEHNRPGEKPEQNRPGESPEQNRPEQKPEQNRPGEKPEQNKPGESPEHNRPEQKPEQENPGQGDNEQEHPGQEDTVIDSTQARQVLSLVNKERNKVGISTLSADSQLNKLAQMKAEDMARKGYFSHTSPTYGSAFDMMNKYGVSYKTAGENIAKGQKTAQAVMGGWMNSSGHRGNILKPEYKRLGVGYAVDTAGTPYWVQIFAG